MVEVIGMRRGKGIAKEKSSFENRVEEKAKICIKERRTL